MTTWHTFVDVEGQPYPTRHRAYFSDPDEAHRLDLTSDHIQQLRAVHEAAHAVVALTGGAHLHYAQITPAGQDKGGVGGITHACHVVGGELFVTFCGAGERAADRWLREQNLWTPERAVRAEVGAAKDRRMALDANPHVGFGDREADYRVVHDLADRAIDQYWPAITAVADVLAEQEYLSGDEVARIVGHPNGLCADPR